TGAYRHCENKTSTRKRELQPGEKRAFWKSQEHWVYPTQPVFPPDSFISLALWERVQRRFHSKTKRHYSTRRASKVIHPLNGLLVCPDCGRRMVLNNCTS